MLCGACPALSPRVLDHIFRGQPSACMHRYIIIIIIIFMKCFILLCSGLENNNIATFARAQCRCNVFKSRSLHIGCCATCTGHTIAGKSNFFFLYNANHNRYIYSKSSTIRDAVPHRIAVQRFYHYHSLWKYSSYPSTSCFLLFYLFSIGVFVEYDIVDGLCCFFMACS